ncbi:MAG: hypothetical protein GY793_09600 [Proteobacteria bacterium]|nr:hypothetical protein [Pseudomonadota bacterium]
MKVLMSIKPKYADKIFNGEKLYEFRRAIFKNREVKSVIVYASSPVQKVIGEFEIDKIIETDIDDLWNLRKNFPEADESSFREYYKGKKVCFAIKVKQVTRYKEPKQLKDFGVKFAPQSFVYVKKLLQDEFLL